MAFVVLPCVPRGRKSSSQRHDQASSAIEIARSPDRRTTQSSISTPSPAGPDSRRDTHGAVLCARVSPHGNLHGAGLSATLADHEKSWLRHDGCLSDLSIHRRQTLFPHSFPAATIPPQSSVSYCFLLRVPRILLDGNPPRSPELRYYRVKPCVPCGKASCCRQKSCANSRLFFN